MEVLTWSMLVAILLGAVFKQATGNIGFAGICVGLGLCCVARSLYFISFKNKNNKEK